MLRKVIWECKQSLLMRQGTWWREASREETVTGMETGDFLDRHSIMAFDFGYLGIQIKFQNSLLLTMFKISYKSRPYRTIFDGMARKVRSKFTALQLSCFTKSLESVPNWEMEGTRWLRGTVREERLSRMDTGNFCHRLRISRDTNQN